MRVICLFVFHIELSLWQLIDHFELSHRLLWTATLHCVAVAFFSTPVFIDEPRISEKGYVRVQRRVTRWISVTGQMWA